MRDPENKFRNDLYCLAYSDTIHASMQAKTNNTLVLAYITSGFSPTPTTTCKFMRHLTPSAALVFTTLACFNNVAAAAGYGTVTFYSDVEFAGTKFRWVISQTQHCNNLPCWDNRASSVKWEGLPTKGNFNGKSRIAFFTGKDCTGDSRDWPTDGYINDKKGNYPMDFTLDGINDAVSSFIVWETSKTISNGTDTACMPGTS